MVSPFTQPLESFAATLAPVFRTKFLLSSDASDEVLLEGRMDRVWRRQRWLWPLFWALSRMDVFFPETGEHVPARLVITPYTDDRGRSCQSWRRTFWFPNGTVRQFNASIRLDPKRECVIESSGLAGMIQVLWSIHCPSPQTLEIGTAAVRWRLGPLSIRVPRWLRMDVTVIEEALDDGIRMALTVQHPLLGDVFGYRGAFQVSRRLRAEHDLVSRAR